MQNIISNMERAYNALQTKPKTDKTIELSHMLAKAILIAQGLDKKPTMTLLNTKSK